MQNMLLNWIFSENISEYLQKKIAFISSRDGYLNWLKVQMYFKMVM